ncbi:hypothetical protein Tco_0903701 [Tanacetum coccineum]
MLVQVYVDDIIFGSTKKSLQRDDGNFSPKKNVDDILKKFDFSSVKTTSTPIETNKALLKDEEAEDQTVVANSTTEAEYVVAANCCGQASQKVGDEAIHKELDDKMERAATTASSLEAEQDSGNINRTQSMATLNESFSQGTDSGSGPRCQDTILGGAKAQTRFETASKQSNDPPLSRVNTLGSGEDSMKLNELIEFCTKLSERALGLNILLPVLVYAARHTLTAVRHKLMLPVNGERQIQALVDKKKVIITETSIRSDLKLDDAEGTDCLPTATIFAELERMGAKTTSWNEFSSTMASAIICLATNKNFNFSKYIFDNMVKNLEGGVKFLMYPRVESSNDASLGAQVDASKQGRKIKDLDADAEVTLVTETQERNDEEMLFDVHDDLHGEEVVAEEVIAKKEVSTADPVTTAGEGVTTAIVEVTTASAPTTTIDELTLTQTLIEIKAAKPKAVTTTATIITSASIRPKAKGIAKDKGKEIMIEPERPLKKKDQVALDEEMARNLQKAQLQAKLIKEERLVRQKKEEAKIALIESWDNTQAMMEADFELAQRLQEEERGDITIEERSRLFVELMKRRKKHFAKLRAEEIRRKPPTKAQKRNQMSTYLKNMAGYKHSQHIEIVQDEEIAIDAIPLATKPPVIVEYKIVKEGNIGHFQLIRANGSSKRYSSMIKMLQGIDGEDLETLWKLVKAKHRLNRPVEDYERVLWGDLIVMSESDIKSKVWRSLQGYKVTI